MNDRMIKVKITENCTCMSGCCRCKDTCRVESEITLRELHDLIREELDESQDE
jgi:hypothetical protein